jgi:hypothetical protein
VLHITNGDTAVPVIRQAIGADGSAAGASGDILPWRDVLHEGPVHASLPLDQLSRKRIEFIADAGWAPRNEVARGFIERDERLRRAAADGEVVLWFEHDLYDQLQLAQLLDWFSRHPHPQLSLVCEADYLGLMSPGRAAELYCKRRRVTAHQLERGRRAWVTFGAADPLSIDVGGDPELPFLGPALRRALEELPWTTDGFSRLERAVLDALRRAALDFRALFSSVREDPAFLGDTVFQWHLQRMAAEGLIEQRATHWHLKQEQRNRRIPRWLGGLLVDEASPWRWNPDVGNVTRID